MKSSDNIGQVKLSYNCRALFARHRHTMMTEIYIASESNVNCKYIEQKNGIYKVDRVILKGILTNSAIPKQKYSAQREHFSDQIKHNT